MRIAIRAGIAVALLFVVYTVWPFVDLYRLARAVEQRDAAALSRQVEFSSVRTAVTRQVLRTYLALTGQDQRMPAFARDTMVGVAAAALQPAIAELVTPERMLDFFTAGWPKEAAAGAGGAPATVDLFPTLRTAWRLYANSEYRFRNFDVSVPAEAQPQRQFRLHLYLIRWRWKLYGVDIPEEMRVRAAQELIKLQASR